MTEPRRDLRGHVQRLRGRKLQRIREAWLYDHPLCARCLLKNPVVYTAATQLDHIVALANGGKDFDQDDGTNRQSLCDACHDEKTAEDFGCTSRSNRRIGLDGFPVDAPPDAI